jgi:PAS domain S-box-containing protein
MTSAVQISRIRRFFSLLKIRIISYVLILSFFFTLCTTAILSYLDYRDYIKLIEQQIHTIETTYLKSLSLSTWDLDFRQVKLLLEGMLRLPGVQYLEVKDEDGENLEAVGKPMGRGVLTHTFSLDAEAEGGPSHLGTLEVQIAFSDMQERFLARITEILAAETARSLILAMLIAFTFQVLIARHLSRMAAYARQLDLTRLDRPLILDRPPSPGGPVDELDQVVAAFNEMRLELLRGIEERIKFEERLAGEKEQLAVTLASIGDAVVTVDTEGQILLMNKVAESLTGWTQEEARGRKYPEVLEILDEHTRERRESPLSGALQTGRMMALGKRYALVARNGIERLIEDSVAPIHDRQDKTIGAVIVFRDVTEKRRVEEELAKGDKLRSIGILAGGIAHDFNNLLTGMLGNVSLLKLKMASQGESHERLDVIEKAIRRASDLTQQLLTFSKGGAPVKKLVALQDLIRDSALFALRGSDVRCSFELPDNLWSAEVDEGQISQVISNLVLNSDQAMPEGGTIEVLANNLVLGDSDGLPLPPGDYVQITLRDSGIGIPRENLSRIFDPFFTTKHEGSGLGLATVHSIIAKHGGHIRVDSEPHLGTTFTITLPASNAKLLKSPGSIPSQRHGAARILVMDDEEMILSMVSNMLRYFGYEADTAFDGEECIRKYREAMKTDRAFDLIIMDLTIPGGLGGKDTIHQLLGIDPDVKAIVSSGYSNDPVMADHEKYGFKGVVCKPYNLKELEAALLKVFDKTTE